MIRFDRTLAALITGMLLLVAAPASAQTSAQTPAQIWPQRPVKFILPLAAGSAADIGARLIADRLASRWSQPIVIENRQGGDGLIAITAFIGARDDHTLLYAATSSFAAHPYQHDTMPYDPHELAPIVRISNTLLSLNVSPSLKVGSLAELLAMIKAQPGKLNYATGTGATDLIFDGYFKSNNLAIARVPYRDVVAPLTDLAEGRIQAYMGALAFTQPHIQAGRVKLIAIVNSQRAPSQPNVPTVAEAGAADLTFDGLIGLFGRKDMPAAVRERIAADVRAVLADPAVVERFTSTSQLLIPGSPTEFADAIEQQRAKLAAIAQKLGIKVAK
jgi:tripartite-type tricarboxylate transporter receptor subunit TctC